MITRALIFDLGKVLVDFSIERACMQVAAVAGTTESHVKSFLFDDGLENRFECGEFDIAELGRLFELGLNRKVSLQDLEFACANIFSPMLDSIALIKELRAQSNLPMVLLSNTNHVHWDFICREYQIDSYFDHHILSFRERVMKPNHKIYRSAIDATGYAPEECFFTDDIYANVIGAKECGIDAVQFQSIAQLRLELAARNIVST